ncbi:MAG: twin-arginine translocase TatA/TatE family subunit [Pirellulales bacterium]|jgi:sec-independent protein translocase protein TatA
MHLLFGNPLLGIFGLHGLEIVIVGLVVLLLFGNRLPSLMRSLGRSVVEFKQGVREIEEDKDANLDDEEVSRGGSRRS